MNASRLFRLLRFVSIALLAIAVSACNTTTSAVKQHQARIEIQEAVGFTIIEDARVSGAVRVDYDQALGLLEQGRLQEGIAALESVVEDAPELSAPSIDLGIAHHRMGDLDAAEAHLVEALDVNPQHPIALNELGIVYRKTARFAEARQSYERALAVYPGYHYARRNLAILCDLYLADLDCARTNYEAYMATVHDDEEVAMWLKDVSFRSELLE